MRVITAVNQKGGAGKTTTTVCVAALAAEAGQRVLVIDLDPQASATRWLTAADADHDDDADVLDVLEGTEKLADVWRSTTAPGVDLVPSSLHLAGAERSLGGQPGAERTLDLALKALGESHDLVIIDSPPSLGLLAISGLAAATEVLLPVAIGAMDLVGVVQLQETVRLVIERINPQLRISAVLPTRVKPRTALARDIIDELRGQFPEQLLEATIRESIRLAEAPAARQPIHIYDPGGNATEDYRRATQEILIKGDGK